jgi:protease-4
MYRSFALSIALVLAITSPGFSKSRSASKKDHNKSTSTLEINITGTTDSSDSKSSDKKSLISDELKKSDNKTASENTSANSVLVLTISGETAERSDSISIFKQQQNSLKDYLDVLRRAREDSGVKAVVVRITSSQVGLAQAQELRSAIAELREHGKKTYGVLEDDSQSGYLVAAACENVVLPPSGEVMLYGVKADAYFFRSLLDKVGAQAHVVHVGQYKSYGEMFTNDDFTTPARANMTEIVDDVYSLLVKLVAKSRDLAPAQVESIINGGPVGAADAKAAHLVDRVAYADDLLAEFTRKNMKIVDASDYGKDSSSKTEDMNIFSIFSLMNKGASQEKTGKLPQVAVVYAVGQINLGSRGGVVIGSDEGIYSDDFIDTLNDVQEDSKVKAVILRVDSPGGSAFASDLIWKKIEELKKHKPVIDSMGDVAASGGYYISMAGSRVIAQEGTMTGSIGVVGGKLDLSGVYKKLGVNKTTISRGQYASLYSETSDFSQQERALIEKMMRRTYDDFISKAAQNRKLSLTKVDEVAQGKVWLGGRAKQVGLVDDLGGMSKAIEETKGLIGLKKSDKVALVTYPKSVGFMEMIQKALSGSVTAQVSPISIAAEALPRDLAGALTFAKGLKVLFEQESVLAVEPFYLSLN